MRPLGRFAGVVTAVALLVGACGPATKSPPSTTTAPSTTGPSNGPPTSTMPPAPTADVRVYFLHGDELDVAHRAVTATPRIATAAMTDLLAGPTPADVAAGVASAIPAGTRLLGLTIADGTATVDLSGVFAAGGGSLSMAARLAQVTYTLTQFPTVEGVVFRLDGRPLTVLGGEGIVIDHPASRSSFEALAPAILAEFPGRGWAVQSPLRASGTANVFEGQFQAELTDSAGQVLARQIVHASSGSGTRGGFTAVLSFTPPTSGPGTLTLFDTSPKDGSRIDVVQIPLELVAAK